MSTCVILNPRRNFLQCPLRVYQALFISFQVDTSSSGLETGTGKVEQPDFSPQHNRTTADPSSGNISFNYFFFSASIRVLCLLPKIVVGNPGGQLGY